MLREGSARPAVRDTGAARGNIFWGHDAMNKVNLAETFRESAITEAASPPI
jgi:hypothetical protein